MNLSNIQKLLDAGRPDLITKEEIADLLAYIHSLKEQLRWEKERNSQRWQDYYYSK